VDPKNDYARRYSKAAILILLLTALIWLRPVRVPAVETAEEARAIALEAYIYFYPLVTMDLTRGQLTNVGPGKELGKGPLNIGMSAGSIPKTRGVGQAYFSAHRDNNGHAFDGGKTYRLHVPPNAPAKQFRSVTLYDIETRILIQNKEQIVDRSSRQDPLRTPMARWTSTSARSRQRI
jgi:hypothetical protein